MPRPGRGDGQRGGGRGGGREPGREGRKPDRGPERRRDEPGRQAPAKPEPQQRRDEPRQDGRRAQPPPARGRDRPPPKLGPSIEVGATENKPELVETIPIGRSPGPGQVVLSLGPGTRTETPLPDLIAGDRLLAFAELELTTDAEDPNHPGRIGNAYSYAPNVSARLLVARSADAVDGGIDLSRKPWREAVTHRRHHAVVTFGDAEARIPAGWKGEAHVNLVVDASHPDARPGDLLLVGQNEKTPTVVQDMAGIRVVRFRPGDAPEPAPDGQGSCLSAGIPIAKQQIVVLTHEIQDPQEGERLLIRGTLVTDARGLAAPARISTRMFIADGPDQVEPGGAAASMVTWKGHLSKFTGFNCIPGEGAQTSRKYGVAVVRAAPGRSLHVNMVAVSAAPFGGNAPTDQLRVDAAASSLRVTRFAPAAAAAAR